MTTETQNKFSGGGVLQHWTKTPATSDLTQLTQDITELKQLIQTGITAVKSIQRGVTTEATTITIDAVDMTKAVVLSNSKGSAGHVAARGSLSQSPSGNWYTGFAEGYVTSSPSTSVNAVNFPSYSGSLTGGTTDLTTRQYSARLISDNQIQCDGAVEWQIIEFN